jgi:hypothetical protein
MTVFEGVIQEELERAKSHVLAYESLIAQYPKGYVSILTVSGKRYAYLKWREGCHIRSRYLGLEGSEEERLAREKHAERKRLQKNLREAQKEEIRLQKALTHYGKK